MLQELDSLTSDLLPRRLTESKAAPVSPPPAIAASASPLEEAVARPAAVAAPPEVAHEAPAVAAPVAPSSELDEVVESEEETPPTLYLEERLRLANLALAGFGKGIRELDERWSSLRQTAETLSQEIQRAQRELEFVRGARPAPPHGGEPVLPPLPPVEEPRDAEAAATVWPTGRVAPSVRRLAGRPLPSTYGEFTANRYNRTIGDLKARRKKLAGYTIGFAALISVGLLILTAIAHEPTPPFWMAALPAVWMVPVPFFIASFRGTHRVLRRNHLELAAD